MIELIGISKHFGLFHALDKINLMIQQSEIVGIVGKSGAGKSTLVRCMNLLERPDVGQVKIDGQALLRLSPQGLREARHQIGMVFQHFNLLNSKTVYDNIALPLRVQGMPAAAIDERIVELLQLVELSHKKDDYPSALSGGQKQRVAIARALASKPKILLCDEATSALDPETTLSILSLLKKINALYGITIILITHDMDVVKQICHRVVLMESGKIVEDFPLSEVFRHPTSQARQLLYQGLVPTLPDCFKTLISSSPTHRPLLQLFFQGEVATVPFISQTSRDLNLNINILLASIDRVDSVTCGALVVELLADAEQLERFVQRCIDAKLSVEVLGYAIDAMD